MSNRLPFCVRCQSFSYSFFQGDGHIFCNRCSTVSRPIEQTEELSPNKDNVNSPKHYSNGKIEVIDFIEDKDLGFNLGNVVKYVSRAGKKDKSKTIEDLEKAKWYLSREIDNLKKEALSNENQ